MDAKYGVYRAVVTDNNDPDTMGRVRIRLPGRRDDPWARLATFFLPEVNDEVLVAFEAGDPRTPYVVGGLWTGSEPPGKR